jgi:hypothetical protein
MRLAQLSPAPVLPGPGTGEFSVTIFGHRSAYVVTEPGIDKVIEDLVARTLDAAGLRTIGGREWGGTTDESTLRQVISSCSVLVAVTIREDADWPSSIEVRIARTQQVPVVAVRPVPRSGAFTLEASDGRPLHQLVIDLVQASTALHAPYAFMAVRIHDDFGLVREAIRAAVERELAIPCIYFEDRRVVTNVSGVRERTRELIRHAALFVADLTHTASNPTYDSPNTAHEIGMASAYGVPIVVCAQLPRRNLYFSAGDLEALFWKDEEDLAEQLSAWLRPRRNVLGLPGTERAAV